MQACSLVYVLLHHIRFVCVLFVLVRIAPSSPLQFECFLFFHQVFSAFSCPICEFYHISMSLQGIPSRIPHILDFVAVTALREVWRFACRGGAGSPSSFAPWSPLRQSPNEQMNEPPNHSTPPGTLAPSPLSVCSTGRWPTRRKPHGQQEIWCSTRWTGSRGVC